MSSYPDFALLAVPALREMQMHTSSHTAGNADADYSGLCVIDILTPSKILWFYKSRALATHPMEKRPWWCGAGRILHSPRQWKIMIMPFNQPASLLSKTCLPTLPKCYYSTPPLIVQILNTFRQGGRGRHL